MEKNRSAEKPYVSDDRLREIILDGVNSGGLWVYTKTAFYDYCKTIIKIDKARAYRVYEDFYPKLQLQRNQAKIELGLVTDEQERIKAEIGTKFDRLKNLKEMVDEMKAELKDGYTSQTKYLDGTPAVFKRPMTQTEKNFTRKTIKEVQGEISKIEGDYAEIKVTGEINNNVSFSDIESMTDEEQLILLQADKLLNKR